MKELTEVEIFLKSVIGLKITIDATEAEIKMRQGEVSTLKGIRYDLPHVSGGRSGDLSDKVIAKEQAIERLTSDLVADIEELNGRRKKLHELIALLPTAEMKSIIQYRYILGYSWNETAERLHFTDRNARYIFRKAINAWNEEYSTAVEKILAPA